MEDERIRVYDGIPYILYKVLRNKKKADAVAQKVRKDGYYVRIIKSSRGYEIWASKNAKWYYSLIAQNE